MEIQRDYGRMNGAGATGPSSDSLHYTLVYLATHSGTDRLLYMNRSFISFSYGYMTDEHGNIVPLYIENFNLIATINNNSLNRAGYAEFSDITSTYDILDGLQYWNTHYITNSLEFDLVSDGIDLKELDKFLHWFRAGEAKELILAEHPNRAILARVANPPQLDLLPFEEKVDFKIAGATYTTSTTLYKGHITLSLVMDLPHWYAIDNILGKKDTTLRRYVDLWKNALGTWEYIFESLDALKILYEDGIPLGSTILHNMLLGNGAYANVEGLVERSIWDPSIRPSIQNYGLLEGAGACIMASTNDTTYTGKIHGAIVDIGGNGIDSIANNQYGYFYYSGTAPAPTVIRFTITPTINNSTGYVEVPANSKVPRTVSGNLYFYDVIKIESVNVLELRITTPNVYTSFNKAIEIFSTEFNGTNTWEDIRRKLREEVRHTKVREWAVKVLTVAQSSALNLAVASASLGDLKTNMAYFLKDSSGNIQDATFIFNSETGEAKGTFKYRAITGSSTNNITWSTYGTSSGYFKVREEDVGDMLRSNYIVIRDRNRPTDEGFVTIWEAGHKDYSHRISHSLSVPLSKFLIIYKNMYL